MPRNNLTISHTSRMLHWLIAIGFIALLAVGVYMEQTENLKLYPWHKSFGVVLGLFILWRVVRRARRGFPQHISKGPDYERVLSKIVHWLLIIGTVLMPVSGFVMSAAGGFGVDVFGFTLVASNFDPVAREAIPHNKGLADFAHTMHGLGGKILIGAVILHIIGAYKHHFMDKDATLTRMINGRAERDV